MVILQGIKNLYLLIKYMIEDIFIELHREGDLTFFGKKFIGWKL